MRVLLAAALALAIALPFTLGGTAVLEVLGSTPWWLPLAGLLTAVLCWNCNAARVGLLSRGIGARLPHGRALLVVMGSEFAICASPGGFGGPVAHAWLMARRGYDSAAAAAIYVLDKLMDLAFFAVALPAMLLWLLWSAAPDAAVQPWLVLVPGASLLLGGALLHALHRLRAGAGLLHALSRWRRSRHLALRGARWLGRLRDGGRALLALPAPVLGGALLCCVLHWVARYSLLWIILQALGAALDWRWLFVVQAAGFGLGQVTALPGGTGGVELGVGALLAPSLPVAVIGAALVIWRALTFHLYLALGAVAFAVASRHKVVRAPGPVA